MAGGTDDVMDEYLMTGRVKPPTTHTSPAAAAGSDNSPSVSNVYYLMHVIVRLS